jgi:hypothetical protein
MFNVLAVFRVVLEVCSGRVYEYSHVGLLKSMAPKLSRNSLGQSGYCIYHI